ncbi:type II toxin-antitoxin system ParD family antitoxin [Pseudomonas sp.]|uniref:ribbon-helix-helix domain-containing protein n=1 Tax=Pseudomonas sp. TaxID=306 RepID=UPI00257C5431|nr:type II toxin-antitoxin system ParD family antitoxin [Pseudomonas sp.]
MVMHRKTVALTGQQDLWIKEQVGQGHFGNDSENFRDLINRDQQAFARVIALRQALNAGALSANAKPLDMSGIKQAARCRFYSED